MSTQARRLSLRRFLEVVRSALDKELDSDQRECVVAKASDSLFLVAGPGTGKTTAITLRILRFIFVDRLDPAQILATTFTNRAADELRSRILGWGARLRTELEQQDDLPRWAASLDLNRIVTGTLDSISEEVLRSYREPGSPPPVVIEEFAADALMTHAGLLEAGRYRSASLEALLRRLRGGNRWLSFAEKLNILAAIRDRISHDQIDLSAYVKAEAGDRGAVRLRELLSDYLGALDQELVLDFPALEERMLQSLTMGGARLFASPLVALFVDEYQDTNYLQEQIYFSLLPFAVENGGSLTVVGDDDQSLYRFRGATVELFRDFPSRVGGLLNRLPRTIYLTTNYRSTPNIVSFCDSYVRLDRSYQGARVTGKPDLQVGRSRYTNYPIVGVFRPTRDELADAITGLLDRVFNGEGWRIPRTSIVIRRHRKGSVADCAILCGSPRERDYQDRARLPLLLRDRLHTLRPAIEIFNPRGIAFHTVPDVAAVGGLILECLDPDGVIQGSMQTIPNDARATLDEWRDAGVAAIAQNPPPRRPISLRDYVRAWQRRRPTGVSEWPPEAPLAELLYKLATWFPGLVGDVEGLVYLEVFGRTITEATRIVEPIVLTNPLYAEGRLRRLIREVFIPLATGAIDVNEDLLETLPGDRLGLLSIHQAKGLEFPMVIVDVGSDYPDNRPGAAKRFPRNPSLAQNLEEYFAPYSRLGRLARAPLERAFDDLVRQYFVAFSRSKDVLVLCGLGDPETGPKPNVKNVAAGWTRDESQGSLWEGLPHVVLA